MILTACYVYATFQQSWRITSICTKIAEKIKDKTSIVFYVLHSDINDATSATSELCTNRNNARICDFLWLKDNKRGCCLVPKQIVHLGPWVSFPSLPTLIPITTNYESSKALQIEENNKIYLLLETEITRHPSAEEAIDCDEAIKVEEFGKPIAWKMDSNLAILLETDLINFTKLLMTSFLRDRLIINDNLPLIRIESLNYGGTPQPYNEIKSHIQKHMTSRIKSNLTNSEWKKHIESLRGLSILANQASEYEYNKNRTEGKTGIIKPDLIPSKSIENLSVSPLNASTPIKSAPISPQISEAPTEILISPKRKLSTICNSIPIKTPAEGTPSQSPKKALEDVSKKASVVLTPPEEIVEEHKTFIIKTPKKLIVPKTVQRPAKPPNVLIYSNDSCVFDRTLTTLREVLEPDMYTIYPLTDEVAEQKVWMDNTSLLVVCGVISDDLRKIFVEFFLKGGHIMSLCSELFYEFFPEVQTLKTEDIGRLVIYAPVISSTMHVINDFTLAHGTAVIARQQSDGKGRGGNQWLSPEGCSMFSLQIHIPMDSPLGSRIPLVQHLISVAIVKAIRGIEGLQSLDIGLKWPNDIYINGKTKIGGLIINSNINQSTSIINAGCALNVNNSSPTTCINDAIKTLNKSLNKSVHDLSYEKSFAIIFNEIEIVLNQVQKGNFGYLYNLYYQYWLHSNQDIKILDKSGLEKEAKITGIDDYGFLNVQLQNGAIETVHPDGNSFDMLKGLILPKTF
ncbi:HLCS family protein [Megaselia abdita]